MAYYNVKNYGSVGDGVADDTIAIQAAINFAAATLSASDPKSAPLSVTVVFPSGNYVISTGLVINMPIVLRGSAGGAYGTRLVASVSFPPDGAMLTVTTTGTPATWLAEENHLSGWGVRDLCFDGGGRASILNGLRTEYANRGIVDNVHFRWIKGSAFQFAYSLRETQFTNCRSWLCGDNAHPVVDLFDQGDGTRDGHNLNQFIGCQFALNVGNGARVGSAAGGATIVRTQTFIGCVFHGFSEGWDYYSDSYWPEPRSTTYSGGAAPVALQEEGGYNDAIVVENARDISFVNCRFNQNGSRGQPVFLLKQNAVYGAPSLNTVAVMNSWLFPKTGYAGRNVTAVDMAADTLSCSEFVATKNDLSTGSRVQFAGASLPAPLVAATDYYAIRVDETLFKVATSRANAIAGTAIDLTTAGSGAITITQRDTGVGTVDSTANMLTIPDHRFSTGARVRIAVDGAGAVPGGLAALTDYFVIRVDKDTIKLASSLANADTATGIDISDAGSGSLYLAPQVFGIDASWGTIAFGAGNFWDGIPNRAYFYVKQPGASALVDPFSQVFLGAPVQERSDGSSPYVNVLEGLQLPNNLALNALTTGALNVQLARLTGANTIGLGNVNNVAGVDVSVMAPDTVDMLINSVNVGRFDTVGLKLNNAGRALSGSGVPAGALGSDGDYYFRTGTPSIPNQRIYVRAGGVWVGIV